jgi:hypothetical protein
MDWEYFTGHSQFAGHTSSEEFPELHGFQSWVLSSIQPTKHVPGSLDVWGAFKKELGYTPGQYLPLIWQVMVWRI